jgi:twinkle protein
MFTSSTQFECNKSYNPFQVFAILEHGGDYVSAAKKLYADGYGTRIKPTIPIDFDTTPNTGTVKISQFKDDILNFYKGARDKGLKLELKKFDKLLRFEKGYFNVVTGIPTHGKSEFVDFISIKLAKLHDWKIVYFSPENYPLEIHFNKLAEKYHERSMFNRMSNDIDTAIDFIDQHYRFINATESDLSIEKILSACMSSDITPDCLILDPWNEIEHSARPSGMTESDFTGDCLRKLRKFARKNKLCLFIVVHPTKMYKDRTAEIYPVPTLYDISGSANWYNKADNGIVVYRDFVKETTEVYIKKVKFKNYGEVGAATFKYLKESGTYAEINNIGNDFDVKF